MKTVFVAALLALALMGCTTEQWGGLAAGMKQGQEMSPPVRTTYCTRVDDQLFCQTR